MMCFGPQIAGNSVHVDLAFLRKHMPRLVEHLHYRCEGPGPGLLTEAAEGGSSWDLTG